MIINVLLAILLVLIVLIVVLLFNTIRFKPDKRTSQPTGQVESAYKSEAEKDAAMARFQSLLRVKTVSYNDQSLIDYSAFDAFENTLAEQYPLIHANCEKTKHGTTGLLFRWKGKSDKAPVVLMSHYDVVPVNQELWTKPAFDAILEDDVIWARGTLDTKGTLFGVCEAVEAHIKEGTQPDVDIYLSFSGDEEISGDSAPSIVSYLKKEGVKPALVLDEGGAIVEEVFPGLDKPCALIGVAEKGYLDVSLKLKGHGGHASAPPAKTLVSRLAAALLRIDKHPFKSHFTPAVTEMFTTLGKYSSFTYRLIFANLWCFAPVLKLLFKKQGGEMNALIRTTIAPTKMEGSKAFNVMPPAASIGLNLRLLGTDTVESAIAHLKTVSGEAELEIEVMEKRNASPYSRTDTEAWQNVSDTIGEVWKDVIVSPYLMLAASDSRHFCEISENVLRFSAMTLSKEERGLIHGNDERITVKAILETVSFYKSLIRKFS